MIVVFVMAAAMAAFGISEIVTTGGDWAAWALTVMGVFGMAAVVVGETRRARQARRRTRQRRDEYRAIEERLREQSDGRRAAPARGGPVDGASTPL